jgi:hypothetical protein
MRYKKITISIVSTLVLIAGTFFLSLEDRPINSMLINETSCWTDSGGKQFLSIKGQNAGSFEPVGPWFSRRPSPSAVEVQMKMSKLQSIVQFFRGSEFDHVIEVTGVDTLSYGNEKLIWSRTKDGCDK